VFHFIQKNKKLKENKFMKTAVRYYSKSGNTKKLASAIAEALGVTAASTDEAILEQIDVLFLGGALYAGGIDAHLRDYIKKLSVEKVKSVALFSSSASGRTIRPQVEKLLNGTGITIVGNEFAREGRFLFIHSGRPNEKDCAEAAAFAKAIIGH
jgi:flavodoxin